MRWISSWCVGMYVWSLSRGVKGLLLIMIVCRYGAMLARVGILLMFSLVYINLYGIVSMLPLASMYGD